MRMRYERRDPRPEDLRQIDELKSLTDSQEKDIFYLTEQLRALQMQHSQLQQQFSSLQNGSQSSTNSHNPNQQSSKKGKNKNTKNSNNSNSANSNNVRGQYQSNSAENGFDNVKNQQMNSHMPASANSQIQINVNNENEQQQQPNTRVKPPPLIKTVIYEEENENELYEEQLREERENAAERMQQQQSCEENGVMIELVPESPDYLTKHQSGEEISEARIITDSELLKNVPILAIPQQEKGEREIQVEVISTIEPANIQVVPKSSNGTDF